MEEQKEPIPGSEVVSGWWAEDRDSLGNRTWDFKCSHGTANITDEATNVPSKLNGAHYRVEVKPIQADEEVDFKWTLPDAQAFALKKLGFRTEEYDWTQTQDSLTKLQKVETRDRFFQPNRERLEHMAFRATKKGLARDEFITVAIDVDDPSWSEVVETLMPGCDWQAIRDRGEKPVARGTVLVGSIVDFLCQVCPDIAPALTGELPQGIVRAVVMADGGASVYYIEPFPHFKDG